MSAVLISSTHILISEINASRQDNSSRLVTEDLYSCKRFKKNEWYMKLSINNWVGYNQNAA